MRAIRVQNPILDETYRTRLASDYSSGTTVTVENNASFSANDLLVVGAPREELTEAKKLNSTSGSTTLTIASALNFAHGKGTYVYKSVWEYISIERRTSAAGAFSEISQSPIQWDNAEGLTIYYDSPATDDYQYRFRFYNSITGLYSEYSPTLTGAGFERNQAGYLIKQVRSITNDLVRKVVSDDEIIRFFNQAQDIIYAHNPRYWFLLVDTYKGSDGIAAVADTNVYSLAQYETYGHMESLRYLYNSGTRNEIYHLVKKTSVEFDALSRDLSETNDDNAECYKLLPADSASANGYIQVYPKTKTSGVATFYPNYYEKMENLNSVDDETQVPMPDLLSDYATAQIERIKGNDKKYQLYHEMFFGPEGKRQGFEPVYGIALLDDLDHQQKSVQGQPRNLWNYRGQKAVSRLYGNAYYRNRDYYREFYDE